MEDKMIRPEMIRSSIEIPEGLTPEVIKNLIDDHKRYLPIYEKLQNYYEGKNDILKRKRKDVSKPNNRIASGFANYIVKTTQGYFTGKPISYSSDDKKMMKDIQEIFNLNKEQDQNSELSKMMGIKGKAYEIVFTDEHSNLRFEEFDAESIIMVYTPSKTKTVSFAIRYYNLPDILQDKKIMYVEVYTKDVIQYYTDGGNGLALDRVEPHYFGQVPVIEYINNDEGMSDFELVIPYIDAYDKTVSDTVNDLEEFTDNFLVLVDVGGTTKDDINELKENKVLLLREKGQAYWLEKNINDTFTENHKNRLAQDIYRFAGVPDPSEENMGGNSASGIALEYKLQPLEQIASNKERKFKMALMKRIEMIVTYLNIKGGNHKYTDLDITFKRNRPVDVKGQTEIALMLKGITSDATAISQLSMIDDYQMELDKIESEKAAYKDENIDLDNIEEEENEAR